MNRILLALKVLSPLIMTFPITGCTQTNKPSLSIDTPDWENQQVIQRNRQPAHATLIPYPDEVMAQKV